MAENDVNSKFSRVFLIVVTVVLVFAGPTYVPYMLSTILNLNYIASMVSGFALFIVGLLLTLYLIRKKIVT
jgi:hypothetical protein